MALKVINLRKDKGRTLNRVVTNVYIQTNENLYSGNNTYNAWKNAGFIEEAGLKLKAEPKTVKTIDGTDLSKGFQVEFELTSLQFYSLYEFEKLNNELCTLRIDGPGFYLKNIPVTVSLDGTFNENGDAKIVIKGSKLVNAIRDVVDGGDPWNPSAPLAEPWEAGSPSPGDAPDRAVPTPPSGGSMAGVMAGALE